MKPTEILKDEHRVIEQVLAALARMADQAQAQGTLNAEHARDAVEFFRNFADRCHHGKEEAHLFTRMEARGFPREGGPTGVMLNEHEQGRAHVRAMAEAIDAAAAGDKSALERWIQLARGYVALLGQHIEKEDHCLFAMADQALTPADQAELAAQFESVEHEHMGLGTHERYLKLANELADAYGVPRAKTAAGHGGCGCGHHH
jgi:hemerythrin-like domain-containing protein